MSGDGMRMPLASGGTIRTTAGLPPHAAMLSTPRPWGKFWGRGYPEIQDIRILAPLKLFGFECGRIMGIMNTPEERENGS